MPTPSKRLLALFIILMSSFLLTSSAQAYSQTQERPTFLAWPLPSHIGVARISQFPNTPWTWNYLGLNPGQQCTPAFGYLEAWLPTWRDTTLSWEQDAAQADPHQFQMIACYSTGGAAGANGHEGTDIKAPASTPVLASADGKVAGWRLWDINTMLVLKHCLGGTWDANHECAGGVKWYTTYMHITIDPVMQQMDLEVKAGTPLGTIYNQGDNSHLHFEVGLDQRHYDNYVNPWGRDRSPWLGCMWKDQSLCVIPNPARKQMLFQSEDGSLIHKKFYQPFETIPPLPNAVRYQVVDDRIAALTNDGVFWMLDPASHWLKVEEQVADFQLTATRIGVLKQDGMLRVQEGAWLGTWNLEATGVKAFSLSPHRVGVLTAQSELFIVEGALTQPWQSIAAEVSAFQLIDTRVAYVNPQGELLVQEGALDSEWKLLGRDVRLFQLSGVRVAYLNASEELWVNHGNLRGEFLLQAQGVQLFQSADDRILVKEKQGSWKIKAGSLYAGWMEIQMPFAEQVILNGQFPTAQK